MRIAIAGALRFLAQQQFRTIEGLIAARWPFDPVRFGSQERLSFGPAPGPTDLAVKRSKGWLTT